MKSLSPFFFAAVLVPLSAVAASSSDRAPLTAAGNVAGQNVDRLALISYPTRSDLMQREQLRHVAASLRAESTDLLNHIAATEDEIRSGEGMGKGLLEATVLKRQRLIDSQIRTGRSLRLIEATLAAYGDGAASAPAPKATSGETEASVKTRLKEQEALAIAERTLTEGGRKPVNYWSLSPTVMQQDGRTLWRFRFHMKETNMPMDLSVGVTVDDESGVGAIEPKGTDPR